MCIILLPVQEEKHQALVKKRDILDKKLVQSEKTGAKIVRRASVVGDTRSGQISVCLFVSFLEFFLYICEKFVLNVQSTTYKIYG